MRAQQPEALRLARELEGVYPVNIQDQEAAAAELRRLHAANINCVDWFEEIKADNERLNALNADLLHALTRIRALPVHADAIRMAHKHAEDAIAKATNNAK